MVMEYGVVPINPSEKPMEMIIYFLRKTSIFSTLFYVSSLSITCLHSKTYDLYERELEIKRIDSSDNYVMSITQGFQENQYSKVYFTLNHPINTMVEPWSNQFLYNNHILLFVILTLLIFPRLTLRKINEK